MKLSTRTRYGARALAELAAVYPHKSISVKELARGQSLSVKYLEQIMAALKSAGLVRAARGLHGGYELAAPPERITMYQVFEALEGGAAMVECVGQPECCEMSLGCPTRPVWVQLNEAVVGVLSGTTLRDLAERVRGGDWSNVPMYEI